MKKKMKVVGKVACGIGVAAVILVLALKLSAEQDSGNELKGRNSCNSYYTTTFRKELGDLDYELQKHDENFSEEEELIKVESGNVTLLFRKGEGANFDNNKKLIQTDYIGGYEFVKEENGYYYSGQRRLALKYMDLEKEYSWEETFRADLALSTNKRYKKFVKENYEVLPAWGLSENPEIGNVTVDGQKIDDVYKVEMDGSEYYLWIIYDLETDNDAADIVIENQ